MLAAQQAPIGAKICTIRAIKTIGRNFRNRRRINQPTFSTGASLITSGVRSRGPPTGDILSLKGK